ncbi:hypothetical protein [Dyella sp. 2RAB6]|uniref:hypothetical protein n=1 Tax=Dyella sp. 2RAB6 TaxID=3232992 RepID=UPI003F8E80CE
MRNVLALLYYLLAVVGCTGGNVTDIHSEADGRDIVHGKIELRAGVAKFECLASASGQCHFALFDPACVAPAASCDKPPERFALAQGASREIVGLPAGFRPCVSAQGEPARPDCKTSP